ncbi:rhomboid family intramembrane serine protease [Antrihabitans sp. YC2-6]|uniref:rhomboid family intramembrane serine protease n=1 Tax=Antrihabitans sp. YC2-6 TaxID=2799498 RepID=UPI0027DB7390|nr:rhomboid family intramembrane serine protease [Antrihabitans sp. YC2-6]
MAEAILYVVVLALAWSVARSKSGNLVELRLRPGPVVLWSLIAVPSLLALVAPGLIKGLERTPGLITYDDEWWRVVTSVLVQDQGVVGTAVNLLVLAAVVVIADPIWGTARMFTVFACSHILFGLLATYVFPTSGAGSSAATAALASSIVGLVSVLEPSRRDLWLALAVSLTGVALLVLQDVHGVAVLTGVVVGAVVGVVWPPDRVLASVP